MFSATLREWKRKIEQLRQRWRAVRQENERLRKETEVLRRREKQWESEREQWERERKRLERERERLREEIDNLKRPLEEAQRANKRQAAPFSRGTRKEHPKTPGRKPAAAYGRRYASRGDEYALLTPEEVDGLVAPIALYPDALVAQVLGAATFPYEIVDAVVWLKQNSTLTGESLMKAVDQQSWDPAVKALTQFPSVLDNLAKNLAFRLQQPAPLPVSA